MEYINLEKWNRKNLYKIFSSYLDPTLRVDVRIDVSKIVDMKDRKMVDGFFIPFTYLLTKAMNEFKGLRLRQDKKGVFDCGVVNPSFTVSLADGNFDFAKASFCDDYKAFEKSCREAINQTIANAKKGILDQSNDEEVLNVAFVSSLPFIDVVSFSNPLPLGDNCGCSIPRLNFSKYVDECGKKMMTLSNTFSHALVDGKEVSDFIIRLQELINNADVVLR